MPLRRQEDLKHLQSRKAKIEIQLKELKREARETQEAVANHKLKLQGINRQIEDIEKNSRELVVSEHALLRYLERVKGIDLDSIRQEMLSDKTQTMYRALGPGMYPIEGAGAKMVIKGTTVVSVVTK